ncbi:hypothetical protein KQI15_02205 [Intestinimonas butyriciproducens]|nr:hypothetical protein [Intestinimonas butyriciproducens]MBU5228853.1 hypothetical protein [Intestinimonas butyriciproducens]
MPEGQSLAAGRIHSAPAGLDSGAPVGGGASHGARTHWDGMRNTIALAAAYLECEQQAAE